MGYTTRFTGAIKLSRSLTIAEAKYILEVNCEDAKATEPNPGGYMQWVPSTTLDHIVWDENEKFYDYTEWMAWMCRHLQSLGIEANGELFWQGESTGDTGTLRVVGNVATSHANDAPAHGSHRPLDLSGLRKIALDKMTASP